MFDKATDTINTPVPLTNRTEWRDLKTHAQTHEKTHIRNLFAQDGGRFENFHTAIDGLIFDYSKQCIDDNTKELLINLARSSQIEEWRDLMFSGAKINNTEDRAVLHTAMRRPATESVTVDGEDVMPFVHAVLKKMRETSNKIRDGVWTGYSGKAMTDIVNIGIGGSDLGPLAVCEALKFMKNPDDGQPDVHFVSNVDGAHIAETLKTLSAETTLFIVASKTFTTQETMKNAHSAREWLLSSAPDESAVAQHFMALSTNMEAVRAFGIAADNMMPFREWVGGRYSLWSAIGFSICLAYGFETFRALLDGAYAMDQHFQNAPLENNIPVLMALTGVWNNNFLGIKTHALLPYSQYLHRFPAFVQQLDMESNGKSVDRDGRRVEVDTGPVIFGEAGTNGQHAFYQLLHQGTQIVSADFIGYSVPPENCDHGHHRILIANMVAQAQAMMEGDSAPEAPWKAFDGNRPSNILLFDRWDAHHLGMLLALYEHKVFVQGVIWNINSFDQWGVELGKILAKDTLAVLEGDSAPEAMDSSSATILKAVREKLP